VEQGAAVDGVWVIGKGVASVAQDVVEAGDVIDLVIGDRLPE